MSTIIPLLIWTLAFILAFFTFVLIAKAEQRHEKFQKKSKDGRATSDKKIDYEKEKIKRK